MISATVSDLILMRNAFFLDQTAFHVRCNLLPNFYFLGKCIANSKASLQQSINAEDLASRAMTIAESLNKSTIIQRVIEKYNVIESPEHISEAAKKLESELKDDIFGRVRKTPESFNIKDLI
jgi:hypothetical protein